MRPPPYALLASVLAAPAAAFGCMGEGPGPVPALELGVFDPQGRPADPAAMPRQVQFTLPLPFDPKGPGPLLFEGPPDAELLRDLERLPLSSSHLGRAVPLRVSAPGPAPGRVIAPAHTLARGAQYTFAVPRGALPESERDRLDRAFVRALETAADAAAGAAVSGAFPADGSAGVPTGLRSAWITLDGAASGVRDGVWLEDAAGLAVPAQVDTQPCETLESSATTCIRLQPFSPLSAAGRYALRTGSALRDAQGAPIEAFLAQFATAPDDSAAELAWLNGGCGLDEQAVAVGCALAGEQSIRLRLRPDRAALIVAQLDPQSEAHMSNGGEVSVEFRGLQPASVHILRVAASDAIGRTQLIHLEVATTPPLATLSISEVRADPLGSEPAQEFVELWNFGLQPVALQGFTLSDALDQPGTRIESKLELAGAGRALLVADDFDPAAALDDPPAPGAPLVRIGPAITRAGLANTGEPLFLRDPEQHRISAAPPISPTTAGTCIARIAADPRSGEAPAFTEKPCSPGR